MNKIYQITLLQKENKYKPVSALIRRKEGMTLEDVKKEGIVKICNQRYWGKTDLQKYGYTRVVMREYNAEKIAKEKAERYEKIKAEKYASGEWKKPKTEK